MIHWAKMQFLPLSSKWIYLRFGLIGFTLVLALFFSPFLSTSNLLVGSPPLWESNRVILYPVIFSFLFLSSLATKKVAHNINLCLSIYHNFTGYKANKLKFEIFFPDCFNIGLKRRITNILSFKYGSFSFTYLGVSISPKILISLIFLLW